MTVKISPQVAMATDQALRVFARHFPASIFPLLDVSSQAHDLWLDDWASAVLGCTLEAIPDAARRWVIDPDKVTSKGLEIPGAASFGKYAKQVDRDYWRPAPVAESSRWAQPDHGRQRDKMAERAYRALYRDWTLVGEVWDLLLKAAVNNDQRQAVREGRVKLADFDDAVKIVKDSIDKQRADAEKKRIADEARRAQRLLEVVG